MSHTPTPHTVTVLSPPRPDNVSGRRRIATVTIYDDSRFENVTILIRVDGSAYISGGNIEKCDIEGSGDTAYGVRF